MAIAPYNEGQQRGQRCPQQHFEDLRNDIQALPPFAQLQQVPEHLEEGFDIFLLGFLGRFFFAQAPAGDGFAVLEGRLVEQRLDAGARGLAGQRLLEQARGVGALRVGLLNFFADDGRRVGPGIAWQLRQQQGCLLYTSRCV